MTEDLIEEMAKRGTYLNPAMTGICGAAKAGPNIKHWNLLQKRAFDRQEQGIRWAKKTGILIGAGTDTAGTLHEEIAMIAETLGETSVQALEHALGINAVIANRPDMGLLKPGFLANLAAFAGNMTQLLDCPRNVVQTWKDGSPARSEPPIPVMFINKLPYTLRFGQTVKVCCRKELLRLWSNQFIKTMWRF